MADFSVFIRSIPTGYVPNPPIRPESCLQLSADQQPLEVAARKQTASPGCPGSGRHSKEKLGEARIDSTGVIVQFSEEFPVC